MDWDLQGFLKGFRNKRQRMTLHQDVGLAWMERPSSACIHLWLELLACARPQEYGSAEDTVPTLDVLVF